MVCHREWSGARNDCDAARALLAKSLAFWVCRASSAMHQMRCSSGAEPLAVSPQKKEGGRKTVLTMSSAAAIMSGASIGSRDPEAPFNYADGVMVAYKASKSALNQGALRAIQTAVVFSCAATMCACRTAGLEYKLSCKPLWD